MRRMISTALLLGLLLGLLAAPAQAEKVTYRISPGTGWSFSVEDIRRWEVAITPIDGELPCEVEAYLDKPMREEYFRRTGTLSDSAPAIEWVYQSPDGQSLGYGLATGVSNKGPCRVKAVFKLIE
jgi:hypothetical protein